MAHRLGELRQKLSSKPCSQICHVPDGKEWDRGRRYAGGKFSVTEREMHLPKFNLEISLSLC